MSLQSLVKRKQETMHKLHESLDSGQAGSIAPDRNQHTGLTFWAGAHELRTETIYEDDLGNKYCWKVHESDTQTTGDVKMKGDYNIAKDKDGQEVVLNRQYLKETSSPYEVEKVNEFTEFEEEEKEKVTESEEIINAIKESDSGNEPIITDDEEKELKESEEVLEENGIEFSRKYRERVTTPTPDREQNNFGINPVTIQVNGKEVSIYESDEHEDLIKSVVEAVSNAIADKIEEEKLPNLSQGE